MILCDIGNSCAKFQINGEILRVGFNEFDAFCAKILSQNRRVFYINVNPKISNFAPNFIDLAPFVKFKSSYIGLGIDRVFGALFIENGVVIDAGSAITTDIMEHGRHVGGIIYPGFSALKNAFLSISPRLNLELDFTKINNIQSAKIVQILSLNSMPNNTANALIYGILDPFIRTIEQISKDKKIFITGGDGALIAACLKQAEFDENLVFKSMERIVKKEILC